MAGFQSCIFIGNLTKDVELRYTQGGDAVANFDLAINRVSGKDDSGARKEEVLFLKVTVWRKQAENCAEYLKKGKVALVEGYLKEHKWTTPEGQERSRIECVANRVQFLSPRGSDGQGGGQQEDEPVPF
jgi:single-strand DNA-binding protein